MLYFSLGVIVGIMLFWFSVILLIQISSHQRVKQLIERLGEVTYKGGNLKDVLKNKQIEIIEPPDEQAEAVGAIIKENEKRGRDTNIKDLE